jgi:hypothetical protein
MLILYYYYYTVLNSVALSPRANYTDWSTANCRRNLVSTFVDRGVSRGQRGGPLTVVNLSKPHINIFSAYLYTVVMEDIVKLDIKDIWYFIVFVKYPWAPSPNNTYVVKVTLHRNAVLSPSSKLL